MRSFGHVAIFGGLGLFAGMSGCNGPRDIIPIGVRAQGVTVADASHSADTSRLNLRLVRVWARDASYPAALDGMDNQVDQATLRDVASQGIVFRVSLTSVSETERRRYPTAGVFGLGADVEFIVLHGRDEASASERTFRILSARHDDDTIGRNGIFWSIRETVQSYFTSLRPNQQLVVVAVPDNDFAGAFHVIAIAAVSDNTLRHDFLTLRTGDSIAL